MILQTLDIVDAMLQGKDSGIADYQKVKYHSLETPQPAQTTAADMREFADFVADYVAHVQAAKKAGKTAEEAAKTWVTPAKYKGYPPGAAESTAYAQVIMDETK